MQTITALNTKTIVLEKQSSDDTNGRNQNI